MLSRICLSCDRKNAPDAKFCSECGAPLQLKLCRHCHKANDYAAHFCQSCGRSLPYTQPDIPEAEPASAGPPPAPTPSEPDRADSVAQEVEVAARPAPGPPTIVRAFSPAPPAEAVAALPTAVRNSVEDASMPSAAGSTADLADQSSYPLPAIVTDPALDTATRRQGTRGAWLALGVLVLVVAVAVIALVGPDRTIQPQAVQKAASPTVEASPPAARDAAAVAATVPSRAGSAEPNPPPTQASVLQPSRPTERKDAEPPTPVRRAPPAAAESVVAPRPAPRPRPAPARECTAELAALGLCTLPDSPERK